MVVLGVGLRFGLGAAVVVGEAALGAALVGARVVAGAMLIAAAEDAVGAEDADATGVGVTAPPAWPTGDEATCAAL